MSRHTPTLLDWPREKKTKSSPRTSSPVRKRQVVIKPTLEPVNQRHRSERMLLERYDVINPEIFLAAANAQKCTESICGGVTSQAPSVRPARLTSQASRQSGQ